jgi:hypothetical protein
VEDWQLDELADEGKGLLLCLALSGEEAALGALEGAEGEACRAAWRGLACRDESARDEILDAWRARAIAGLPRCIDRLHPSWIEAALAGEPPHILRYLRGILPAALRPMVDKLMEAAGGAGADTGLGRDLGRAIERIAFGHLAPLCEGPCGPLASRLCALDFEALQTEVTRMGARTLARSLAGASTVVRARAMALAGEPWAAVMAAAFAQDLSQDQRRAAIAHAAANVHAPARTSSERLFHIGLAALREELAEDGVGSVFRVAGRLPARQGRQLLGWSDVWGARLPVAWMVEDRHGVHREGDESAGPLGR